ncbi:hypothetical protein BKA64DRAFT_699660 [Cadophora sp. MPI-SDFR-AT-0126]|nr:hypothetical protein BKA64DRAFT_699660 [Leotiomycetes sp. MPI-SDFR-AT-0126]
MASKMPGLMTLDVKYLFEGMQYPYTAEVNRHHSRVWEGPRRDGRWDAAAMMVRLGVGVALKNLVIRFGTLGAMVQLDQGVALPDLVMSLTSDPLSAALRVYSQNLFTWEVLGVVDQTLFWPGEDEGGSMPFWPRLRILKVIFHSAAPSGRWYFEGPKGEGRTDEGFKIEDRHYPPVEKQEGDDEWDDQSGQYENTSPNMFRTKPIDGEVESLLGAFAKALDVMPVLESGELFTFLHFESSDESCVRSLGLERIRVPRMGILSWDIVCRWGLRFVAGEADARLEWHVGKWRPSRDLVRLLSRMVPEEQWIYM